MAGRVYTVPLLNGISGFSQGQVLSEIFTISATSVSFGFIEQIRLDPCATSVGDIWVSGVRYSTSYNTANSGYAITPTKMLNGDAGATLLASVMSNNKTSGSPTVVFGGVWNMVNGYDWTPPDTDHRIMISPATPVFSLQMISGTPSATNTIAGFLTFREIF